VVSWQPTLGNRTIAQRPTRIIMEQDKPVLSNRDIAFGLLFANAILRTMQVDQILYVVLSGATSGEGLGFNRGVFFLVDDDQRHLRTRMAIGPVHEAEAHRIWEDMEQQDLTLETLLSDYDRVKNDPCAHQLLRKLGHLCVPLDQLGTLVENATSPCQFGRAAIEPMLARCLFEMQPLHSRTVELVCGEDNDITPVVCRNWWMVPVVMSGKMLGVLLVDDAFSERTLSCGMDQLLDALANLAGIAIEKSRLFDEMRALAQVDGLTGLANRRTYQEAVDRLLTQARQTGQSLSLLVFDVDNFKKYNDVHGHQAGDDVLRWVAKLLRSGVRKTEVVGRYGGEEFVVVLPDTTYEQAMVIANKLVAKVRTESAQGELGPITVCAGVANSPRGSIASEKLFEQADLALYRAKNAGRDRVEGMAPER